MLEIRIHGRGGQGSVVTAELLAIAAYKSGLYSQAFPYLGGGGERRGAPVQAFCRIDRSPVHLKCQIREPDYLIVQDDSLLETVNIFEGLKPGGLILINSEKTPADLGIDQARFEAQAFPATGIALKILKQPITNTALLGAFAALTGLFNLESLKQAVQDKFPGEIGAVNILAMEEAFQLIKGPGGDPGHEA